MEIRDAISIIPKEYLTNTVLYPMNLIGFCNVKIECFEQTVQTSATKSLMRDFTWTFIVANTMKPLLEYDFLS